MNGLNALPACKITWFCCLAEDSLTIFQSENI